MALTQLRHPDDLPIIKGAHNARAEAQRICEKALSVMPREAKDRMVLRLLMVFSRGTRPSTSGGGSLITASFILWPVSTYPSPSTGGLG